MTSSSLIDSHMIIGNQQAQQILETYMQAFVSDASITPFVILQGPDRVGKMTMIQHILRNQLGSYRTTDAKIAHNLESVLGKTHAFKVEVSSSDQQIIDKDSGTVYANPGARDLKNWLSRAPLGDLKVVVIEDIDRMTVSAANALLKEFEEPLPGRLIIGTVDQGKTILDTILSRAFIVRFHPVASSHMQSMISSDIDQDIAEFVLSVSRGRPGVLYSLLACPDEIKTLQHILGALRTYLVQGGSLIDHKALITRRLNVGWSIESLLESLLAYDDGSDHTMIIQARKYLQTNVNNDTIIRNLLLHPHRHAS